MREEYTIRIEPMSYDEIHAHLQDSSEDFIPRTEQFMIDYAHKLANNAEFVTLRDKDDRLMGVVAFYGNVHPIAYVTHVWVVNFLRGGGYCGKMLELSFEECRKRRFETVRLEVRSDNSSAIHAYKKLEFDFISIGTERSMMEKQLK